MVIHDCCQKRLADASTTYAFVVADAFLVLTRSVQALSVFRLQNKNGSLARAILLIIGAQKRTRTWQLTICINREFSV